MVRCLAQYRGEVEVVPCLAAGEFYEGGACISGNRFQESIQFLERFTIADISRETALRYAQSVSHLRSQGKIGGVSKVDVWIASCALEHGSKLITRNPKDFRSIPGLEIVSY